jgi:uncharacterized integral membrane protein
MLIARRLLLIALVLAVVTAGIGFALRNTEPRVQVDFWLATAPEVSLWLALVIAFGVGALLATAVWLFEVARYGLVARRYRKTVARLESEIHQLRNLPLAEGTAPLEPRIESEAGLAGPTGGPAQRGR